MNVTSESCGEVTVSFKKVKGASGYDIRYSSDENGTYKTIAITKNISYTHSFTSGSTGYYKVRAYRTVKGKKVYSAYSAVGFYTVKDNTFGSYTVTVRLPCSTDGSKTATCTDCGYVNTVAMSATGEHSYVYTVLSEATCTQNGSAAKVCSVCGKTKDETVLEATGHSYVSATTAPTCTEQGYTTYTCSVCGDSYVSDYTDVIAHNMSDEIVSAENGTHYTYCTNDGCDYCEYSDCEYVYSVVTASTETEDGTEYTHLYYTCSACGEAVETDTCRINMTNLTSDDLTALEGVAKLSTSGYKLTLTATKYIDNFELSGEAENITVSVDAYDDADIKLAGLSITNNDTANNDDCIRINNKCTDTDDTGEAIVPTVSVTANNGMENNLTVTASGGKGIQCETKLELKGHGTLNINTVSTSVNPRAKLDIKNITLNITSSGNRGIDTKLDITDESGNVTDTEYSNIAFGANATVIINSYEDGIRCKNMEFEAIDTSAGDTPSVLAIVSETGDAIQLEGKKGLTMYQGYVTLTGGKSTLNNKFGLDPVLYNEDIGLTSLVKN